MKTELVEKRKYSRVATSPSSISEGISLGHPLIIDVSHGGACLWLSDPPPKEQGLALQFRLDGHDRVLQSRMVWSRLCVATADCENPALSDGWLAGFAVAEGDGGIPITDLTLDILRNDHVTVSVLAEHHAADNWQKEGGGTSGLITFSEQSILGVKAAAKELLPVFARHFTDVHMVFTRDRLEISAPFRPPAELNPPEARRRDYHTIQASPAVHPPAPMRIEQPAALVQPKSTRVMDGRRRGLIVVSSLAAVILGWTLLGLSHKSGGTPAAPKVPVEGRSIPAWAAGIDQTSLDDWIEVQKKFDLPDATVRSAIQMLQTNDKYPPGQSLHDLARYPPAQVKRAFFLLAGPQTGTPFDFGPLENDLKGRMVEGVRFPDEAPGGRYASLERESFNNVVVLATIELFHRRQDDPGVKEILAALRRGRT